MSSLFVSKAERDVPARRERVKLCPSAADEGTRQLRERIANNCSTARSLWGSVSQPMQEKAGVQTSRRMAMITAKACRRGATKQHRTCTARLADRSQPQPQEIARRVRIPVRALVQGPVQGAELQQKLVSELLPKLLQTAAQVCNEIVRNA